MIRVRILLFLTLTILPIFLINCAGDTSMMWVRNDDPQASIQRSAQPDLRNDPLFQMWQYCRAEVEFNCSLGRTVCVPGNNANFYTELAKHCLTRYGYHQVPKERAR